MDVEAKLLGGDHTTIEIDSPSSAPSSGEVIKLDDDRAAIVTGLNLANVESGDPIQVVTRGPVRLASASAETFSAGDAVYWDVSANTAIADDVDATGDFVAGRAIRAKTSGQTWVDVDLNAPAGTVTA